MGIKAAELEAISSSSTNAVAVIVPSDKLPNCTVPFEVTFLTVAMSLSALRTTALLAAAVPAVMPSNISSSASVSTALPMPIEVVAVKVPPETIVPETSRLPFKSTVVAAICISVSATRSSCPSAEEWI